MSQKHWENVYQTKSTDQVSWYQAQDQKSFELIQRLRDKHGLDLTAQIIDVGSGASVFIDQLLELGFKHIHVLDLSRTALEKNQTRLREKNLNAEHITWLVEDICTVTLPANYFDLWHDRAVFHFMVTAEQQQQYIFNLKTSLKKGGHLIMSNFAEDGPTQCSGLTIHRYSIKELQEKLGADFHLMHFEHDIHLTPWGSEQKFLHSVWAYQPNS